MIDLADPAQRHIHAITVRDSIVPDDASDLGAGANIPPRQKLRLLRAMLATTDFVGSSAEAALDDPVGRRVGRVAFNPAIRALWIDGRWTGDGPKAHRLPETVEQLCAFIRQQAWLKPGLRDEIDSDSQIDALLGFRLVDHARTSDQLRQGGPAARLFVAASMLSAACARFDKVQSRHKETQRQAQAVDAAATTVQAALIGTARIAAGAFADEHDPLPRIGRVALYLASQVERFRRLTGLGKIARAIATGTEFDKSTHRGSRPRDLVLFYGLEIDEVAILGLRQILARTCPLASSETRRLAFGRTVHAILGQCAPLIAQRLSMTSSLGALDATCKGIANAAMVGSDTSTSRALPPPT